MEFSSAPGSFAGGNLSGAGEFADSAIIAIHR